MFDAKTKATEYRQEKIPAITMERSVIRARHLYATQPKEAIIIRPKTDDATSRQFADWGSMNSSNDIANRRDEITDSAIESVWFC